MRQYERSTNRRGSTSDLIVNHAVWVGLYVTCVTTTVSVSMHHLFLSLSDWRIDNNNMKWQQRQWPWMTLKVIHRLHAFSNAINGTVVQHYVRFQLKVYSHGSSALAKLLFGLGLGFMKYWCRSHTRWSRGAQILMWVSSTGLGVGV